MVETSFHWVELSAYDCASSAGVTSGNFDLDERATGWRGFVASQYWHMEVGLKLCLTRIDPNGKWQWEKRKCFRD
jgi:hypothetical protein